jgi:hypothetical protein
MDNIANAFFTQTIVGAPFSVLLGHQLEADQLSVHGIEIPLRGGNTQLSRVWKDWMVLDCASEPSGKPRRRPGRVRRWLERHALVLALLSIFSLTVSAIFWGFISWT